MAALIGASAAGAQELRLPLGAGPGPGSLAEARGLAVDQESGDVYAIDGRNEQQSITVAATSGNLCSSSKGKKNELPYNASATEVRNALREMYCGGSNCVNVNGGPGAQPAPAPT